MAHANERQIGGDHYKTAYEHWDLMTDHLGTVYLIGCTTKYVARWRKKDGIPDLEKGEHYLEKLIEHEQVAFSGPPFGGIGPSEIDYFCNVNELNTDERNYMHLLLGPWDLNGLASAKELLKRMIVEAQRGW